MAFYPTNIGSSGGSSVIPLGSAVLIGSVTNARQPSFTISDHGYYIATRGNGLPPIGGGASSANGVQSICYFDGANDYWFGGSVSWTFDSSTGVFKAAVATSNAYNYSLWKIAGI